MHARNNQKGLQKDGMDNTEKAGNIGNPQNLISKIQQYSAKNS